MEKNYTRQELLNKNIPELKQTLKSLNLPVSGNKDTLIDRILNYQNKSTYLALLPPDIKRQTLFSLDYPAVLDICESNPNLCNDRFWNDYIKNHYFINPNNISLPPQEVARNAHNILLKYWKKNNYPSWRVLPFIFEVSILEGDTFISIFDRIYKFYNDKISSLGNITRSNSLREEIEKFPAADKFWGKKWYSIENKIKDIKDKKLLFSYILEESSISTLYWTPQGLKELNFDIDIYGTFIGTEYIISPLFSEFRDEFINKLSGYFAVLIFQTFGFL